MHNMSNQFYDYIANLIIDNVNPKSGDRFYIELDNQPEVDQLVNSLSKNPNVEPFSWKHREGELYETFALIFDNNHKLIVAHTSFNVTPGFLVTLRNQVGEQQGVFNNTSLLSIMSEQLDSITGGGADLQKEGMPLHPDSVSENLAEEIENSSLSAVDKVILKNNLNYIIDGEPFQQITLFDFKNIFTTLQEGSIDQNKLYEFGLFKDDDLATLTKREQEKRLEDNREFFDFVKRIHDYGFGQEKLEEKFSEVGAKELIKDDWYKLSYSAIKKYHDDYIKETKEAKVTFDEIKIKQEFQIWDKALNENTAAGRRKRHIIIFNPNQLQEIELMISFDLTGKITSLDDKFVTKGKQSGKHLEVSAKRKNLQVTINTLENDIVFVNLEYKHNNKVALGAQFFIAVLPIDPSYIEQYKTRYLVNVKRKAIELLYDDEAIILGSGFNESNIEINEYNQLIEMSEIDTLKLNALDEAFDDNDELKFFVSIQNHKIPFLLTSDVPKTTPITGQRIRKLIRENQVDMEWDQENNRLIMGNQDFYLHPDYEEFFKWEDEIINEGIKYATYESEQLDIEDIELSDDLREAYSRLITYFRIKDSIPSLCTVTSELKDRAINYIEQFIKEVESFEDGYPAGVRGVNLFKLGTIKAKGIIYFSPVHPLLIAYKIKYFDMLNAESVSNSILSRLTPEGLLPFIYDENGTLYKPEYSDSVPEWLMFRPVDQVSVTDSSKHLAKIVRDKINQFQTHFSYLFMESSRAPIKINIVNIENDFEIIKGILEWMIENLKQKKTNVIPTEITLYNRGEQESSLEILSKLETTAELKSYFQLNLNTREIEEEDILDILRQNISYYKNKQGKSFQYAHMTFYKMEDQPNPAFQPMKNMPSGLAIEGLYSSIPSMKDKEIYRSGFGIKSYNITPDNYLTRVSYFINELAANLRNSGNDSYRKGEAIYSWTKSTDKEILQGMFDSSHWVTFLNPTIDLLFFNQFDEDLVVIHYSDQYSSSTSYDAITVTNKSEQYYSVIKEFLEQKGLDGNNENALNTVKAFNLFNGEWLLRIIGSKGHSAKEKLSIISAIKYAILYLDHPNILWVPISLEEILRVAGAVGLSQSDGVFTAKNLGVKGVHSDDLLLIGLEETEGKLLLYFYPVEVKIGINPNSVLQKARIQVIKTKNLILNSLTGEMGESFEGRFYRNFFVQLFLANARMLHNNDFWNEKNFGLPDATIEKLLKDDFVISNKLSEFIGEGAILSFQKGAFYRSAVIEDDVLLLNLTEDDGFRGMSQPVEKMRKWIQEENHDLIKEDMLSRQYKSKLIETSTEEVKSNPISVMEKTQYVSYDNIERLENVIQDEEETNIKEEKEESKVVEIINRKEEKSIQEAAVTEDSSNLISEKEVLENTRFLIGTAENSNHKIYWEYGHKELANRHLLISGKSGQGKTYFMQCLLLEAARSGISNIVVDYTEGFLPTQLEPTFVNFLGDKLKQKVVYNEGFPINPFTKNIRDIGGIMQLEETETDVAERIRSVFAAVYDRLGIQQLNAIYEATIKGLERFGDQMDLKKLKVILEEDNSSYAKTALSQIRPLIDRNPFVISNTIDWKEIIESNGEVYIIQLAGFNRDVQLIITEFILWDLWNYSIRNGNKNVPIPVIMDEAQNLDHRDNSPSARILTEGRKFGWSAWYATQFLKAQLDSDELARLQNSSQKVYFSPPEEEIIHIASNLSNEKDERKEWERKLASLKKGQCIVHGPVLKPNGELSTPMVNIVNITSLEERI